MRIDVVTTFPELFLGAPESPMGSSIVARARASGAVDIVATNLRDYTENKHGKTDDRPFGGGPGMVMMCQPVWDAVMAAEAAHTAQATRLFLTPQGAPLNQALVEELSAHPRLLMLCGHYEGIDQRVIDRLAPVEVSLGDYVLSSGELAAMVLIDTVVRLLPGVLGDGSSAGQDSFGPVPEVDADGGPIDPRLLDRWCQGLGVARTSRLLDCPQYTRPRIWEGAEVPPVLLSGDHEAVARWRLEQRVLRTRRRRTDLLPDQA